MSFLNLSLPALLIGLAALAAALFLLQRLRVRYREQTVITTLFWKEALEEARARVLVRRFKHPLAYLFVLLIAWLLWLGVADPKLAGATERDHVVLLDGSAGMGRGERFANTIEMVKERVRTLPGERLWVIFCGGRPRTLLQAGENVLLFEARLEGLQPEACPATIDTTLRVLTKMLPQDRETDILVAGDAPVSQTALDLLPERAHLRRLAPPAKATDNQGITALGVARSSSGTWERVDVLCEVQGTINARPVLVVALGGRPVELESRYTQAAPTRTRILLVDVPASGQLLTVRLDRRDALTADDSASIRLPRRQRIRVAIQKEMVATVGSVLAADPAVVVVDQDPDVLVCRSSGNTAAVPALDFVAIESQPEAILLHHTAGRSDAVLVESFQRLGLSEVDAMDVAQASGRRIAIGATLADQRQRRISVWEPLLSERFNFVQSRSFPLFVAQAIRWLAGVEEDPAFVAAGEALSGNSNAHGDAADIRLDPAGADFLPPQAGIYRDITGGVLAASLLDPATTNGADGAPLEAVAAGDTRGGGFDLALLLAAAVLALLFLEWFLYGTGRMP